MDRNEKSEVVSALHASLKQMGVVVVTRNLGLTVAQSTDLRTKMRDAGAAYKVTKNRLAKIAIQDTDYVGLDEYVTKIEGGWVDVDVIIATPSVMPKIGKLGKVLGPRNLMPNPKTGTVTNDVANAISDVKGGKIAFKVDKVGIIHASIGRVSFAPEKIAENSQELINAILKAKPSSAKGTYVRGVSMASSMSPGITIDAKGFIN